MCSMKASRRSAASWEFGSFIGEFCRASTLTTEVGSVAATTLQGPRR
jgi:hypothetical protein